jgi:hypothetical protein
MVSLDAFILALSLKRLTLQEKKLVFPEKNFLLSVLMMKEQKKRLGI